MALEPRNQAFARTVTRDDAAIDAGLRAYMLRVYNLMAMGVGLTGIVSLGVLNVPALLEMFYVPTARGIEPTMLAYIAMFAPLAFVMILSFGINKMSGPTAQLVFWIYAGVMGLSMTHIFMVFTGESIVRVFFITMCAFAALSLYGYTTKRNLSGFGTFLFMGLVGIIIAMVVNFFLQSTMLQFIISAGGVLIFAGLTAYDTQKIKSNYEVSDSGEIAQKKAVYGALMLYLDFVTLFMFLLHFLGNRD